MDDLTVLDGDCEKIIKQGKFLKCKPQINHSFIPILAKSLSIEERPFVLNCNMCTTFHFCLTLQQVQTATLKRVCAIGMFIRDGF